jgi:hypothetical protein
MNYRYFKYGPTNLVLRLEPAHHNYVISMLVNSKCSSRWLKLSWTMPIDTDFTLYGYEEISTKDIFIDML